MKRVISALCALCVLCGAFAMGGSAGAVTAAQTSVSVASGDTVSYTLTLSNVPKPVIGCDFSVYYDASVFDVVSVADYSGATNADAQKALINAALDGEVVCNWSTLSGVDCSSARAVITVNLKAKKKATTHLSYYVRYLYDENVFDTDEKLQINQYKFTCTVKKNNKNVISNAAPELNTVMPQSEGSFINSLSGVSSDADPAIPGTVVDPPPSLVKVTIQGSVKSFLSETDPVTVQLKRDNTVKSSVTVKGNTASYSFSNVAQGRYTVVVYKKNHVTRTYEITVNGLDIKQDVKIHPLGDISGDGRVNARDYGMVSAHAQKTGTLSGYEFACADVVKQDGKVIAADAARISAHAQKTVLMW